MHKLSDVVHMDLNVFGSMSLKWIIDDWNGAPMITIDNSLKLVFKATLAKYPLQP